MMLDDPSFAIDGRVKGSYLRALEDIDRALNHLQIEAMPDHAAFLYSYLACEKLARIMHGVCNRKKKSDVFRKGASTPTATAIYTYSQQLDCYVSRTEIDQIFNSNNNQSARRLRDQFVHEIGPTHAKDIVNRSRTLVPNMKKFLDCRAALIKRLTSNPQQTPHPRTD